MKKQVDEFTEREGDVMKLIAEGVHYIFFNCRS